MKFSIRYPDSFLILPALAGIAMIAETDPPHSAALDLGAWIKGAVLAGLAACIALAVGAASAMKRRCTEEYAIQITANAALVAMTSTFILGWMVSYYRFRQRGIA